MQELLKKLYDDADIDFLIDEAIKLTDIEFKQTFHEYRKAAEYTYNLLKREGIDAEFLTFPADGKTTYQDFRTPIAWDVTKARLTVTKSEIPFDDPVVADYERHPFHIVKGSTATPDGGITARLVTEEQALNGADVTGAVILMPKGKFLRSTTISPMLDRGALGFVNTAVGHGMEDETPDCLTWCNAATDDHSHWHVQSEDRPFIAFAVTPRTGDKLRSACEKGEVEVLVESDGRRYDGEIDAVCGYIKGKSEKEIWLIAHLFEPFFADNSLSVIMAIEIAKKIKEMGTPNFSVRLVFSAETYGLPPVWEHYKESIRGKVLGALDIDTPPAFTFDDNFNTRFNPYCSPFFGNLMFLACSEAYEKVFPGTERCVRTITQFGDDLILGDTTIGVPTVYFEEDKCKNWHSTRWVPENVDRDKVRRSYAFAALWSVYIAFMDEEKLLSALPVCTKIAQARLDSFAENGNSPERMTYFLEGERGFIRDFSRAIDSPEIEKAAQTLKIAPTETDAPFPAFLESVMNIVPTRLTEGFPFDLVKIPYKNRRSLPGYSIYGECATILAKMDGKKTLGDAIREAVWEHDSDNFDEKFVEDFADAVRYLADAGYLKIEEK